MRLPALAVLTCLALAAAACTSGGSDAGPTTTLAGSGPADVIVLTPAKELPFATLDAAATIVRDRIAESRPGSANVVLAGKGIEARITGATDAELDQMVADLRVRGVLQFRPVVRPLGRHERAGLPSIDGEIRYEVGPVGFSGTDLASATAAEEGAWQVEVTITPAAQAEANRLFDACFAGTSACPTKQLAVVLDGVVQSAPTVNAEHLADTPFAISGDFSSAEAKALATALRTAPLPADFTVSRQH